MEPLIQIRFVLDGTIENLKRLKRAIKGKRYYKRIVMYSAKKTIIHGDLTQNEIFDLFDLLDAYDIT